MCCFFTGVDILSRTLKKPVYAYYGIPFAEPPIGPLRFKHPVSYKGRGSQNVISSNT